ncbi:MULTISPECIES: 23S rRNA (pseudouridine(1915)-N(3))-methyltransferase RlmH [Thermoactinomyces]|jgi:23S rRNA (pseudouridine1915-N3)-methyltransferase|uniref:Ribosomal RNA large subunit methyltransferase H n=1 Tax=Thermoactinomyces vulgaris TaxID=2026 RepID=A0ABS0QFK3_THEVU|nr:MULTISPECIES: 23S rRNA (pseudouridine(1915)-N(3))-methyltransferase RlmH [Thermoactinomyces]KFZ39382.1 50S rRNA methyltransferase [Thermoactinomyces sp. Gus2-1]MBA4551132.1 23S rRNA (pseudouridine(1915)-N(3))-methyltransferase RlmH [Thermoactinomyces vulgaris]MBA4596909.1 23S rRNA (pseudouridine(1915)-N(3))-methyltransferase RlmH [Thermoactinomyces vulgaris]MBH8583675.1 23S rRNA (pseudouridine(1915)-N(3))-methyltransferase RlmH [Thermoactinomyces sp. CICC 10735]MBH8586142.1 23S rRNA (pseudo
MKIQIITVGKMKEKYLQQACKEYLKRLTPYAKTEIIEVAEERASDPVHPAQKEQILEKEGQRILRHCPADAFLIALAIEGKAFTSTEFARKLDQLATYGKSRILFVIGGSYGLSPEVLKRSDLSLSFSKMTFPHQLIRVFLLEQIYRAFKINRGETYHK